MKVCIFSDPHWSQNSSIVRTRGVKYSSRLENLIQSINWVELTAWEKSCDCVICCGDFFDTAALNCEEISALKEINWAPISHLFLTGNHETNVSSLAYSTSDIFKLCPNSEVVSSPCQYSLKNPDVDICFLPYITPRNIQTIDTYFGQKQSRRIIFSHNDLKNVQYGSFLSKEGLDIIDIEANCDLFFNGHIHHCSNVTSKIINVGNLTGQNFTEDAYDHCVIILDTETFQYEFLKNPYAYIFNKLDFTELDSNSIQEKLKLLPQNSVITVQVRAEQSADVRNILESMKQTNIIEFRLIVKHIVNCDQVDSTVNYSSSVDHHKEFEKYIFETLGRNEVIQEELLNVLR